MTKRRLRSAATQTVWSPGRRGVAPAAVFDPAAAITQAQWDELVTVDPRDAVLERCQADPTYQRWVLACLQVRISIQADQTFPHPPDRRAQVARIIRASLNAQTSALMLENDGKQAL